ncbi:hypothetical protein MTQ00_07290 [Chryseobacterium sp. B21-037]|uniref:hypothetical protein n=1 Tax=Chryseobacterium sp. B21-037 TaxID=2926038 RepID=UPI00235959C9|nr:hypothetical protein [Chryseobacterium sp. B21-037]MDC8104340.1 hypothetical protein [Chryseobacterium sp. B21-037]
MKKFLFSVLALLTALLLIIGILELTSSYKVSEDINRNAPVQTQQHIRFTTGHLFRMV